MTIHGTGRHAGATSGLNHNHMFALIYAIMMIGCHSSGVSDELIVTVDTKNYRLLRIIIKIDFYIRQRT
jgi:hypothetical protein